MQDKRQKAREAMRSLLFEPDYRQVMCNCVAVINPKLRYFHQNEFASS